jgi:hypothetical protein
MKRLFLVTVAVLMAACSTEVTAPAVQKTAPPSAAHDDIFCESGYVIAFDENGNPICVPDGHQVASRPKLPPKPPKL